MTKRICILGSGLVSSSVVNFFCRDVDSANLYSVTVGSIVDTELKDLQKKYPTIRTVLLDVTIDVDKLVKIVQDSDIVVSLLTNDMQVPIAKVCIAQKVNMVHASYCTKEMMELDSEAKHNDVTILNEVGLDPGIDHLLAMKAIDEIREEERSKITAFISYCGGLPEPMISKSNPLRYKFSWSPLASLKNLLNPARYLRQNEVIEVGAGGALIDAIETSSDDFLDEEIQLEAYPNRNSLLYKDLYGIQEANTIIRGTYRYRGFKKIVKALYNLGLFSTERLQEDFKRNLQTLTWGDLITFLVSRNEYFADSTSLLEMLHHHGFDQDEIYNLETLGLFSKTCPLKMRNSLLEILAEYLAERLKYEKNERDIVLMRHEIRYKNISSDNDNEGVERVREIRFMVYGEQDKGGFSAMSRTVGLTIGHAVKLLLNGSIQRPGVIYPFTKDIYIPVLEQLRKEGLIFIENQIN